MDESWRGSNSEKREKYERGKTTELTRNREKERERERFSVVKVCVGCRPNAIFFADDLFVPMDSDFY